MVEEVVLVIILKGQMKVDGKKVDVTFRGHDGQVVPSFRIVIKGNFGDQNRIKKIIEEKLSSILDEVEELNIKIKSK